MEVAASEKPEREEAKSSARVTSPRPFREWEPEQVQLLPQYAREVLGEGHLASFFVDLREALDFSPIHDTVCTFRVRHLEAFRALFVSWTR